MKNKKLLFGVCLSLLVGAAALIAASAGLEQTPQDDLLRANIEALTSNEGGGYTASCQFSYVLRCLIICSNCKAEHYPSGFSNIDYLTPVNVSGSCQKCGISYN